MADADSIERMRQFATLIPGLTTVLVMAVTYSLLQGTGYSQTEALRGMLLVLGANLLHGAAHVVAEWISGGVEDVRTEF